MTEKDKEQEKKDKEKTDKLLDEVIEAELVPMLVLSVASVEDSLLVELERLIQQN